MESLRHRMRKPAALEEGLGNGNPHDRLTGTCPSTESAHHPCTGVIRMRRSTETSTCTSSEIKITTKSESSRGRSLSQICYSLVQCHVQVRTDVACCTHKSTTIFGKYAIVPSYGTSELERASFSCSRK